MVEDIISVIGSLYVKAGRSLDYVSVNLGYSVEFIRESAEKLRTDNASVLRGAS